MLRADFLVELAMARFGFLNILFLLTIAFKGTHTMPENLPICKVSNGSGIYFIYNTV